MKAQLAPGVFNWLRRSPGGCRRRREASRDGPELTQVRGFIIDWRRDQRLPSRSSPFSSLSYCSCTVACLLSCPFTLFSCVIIQKVIKYVCILGRIVERDFWSLGMKAVTFRKQLERLENAPSAHFAAPFHTFGPVIRKRMVNRNLKTNTAT